MLMNLLLLMEWSASSFPLCTILKIPNAEGGLGSLRGVFAMAGPVIRKELELERNVWCHDMILTVCYLIGWPMPGDAEGAIILRTRGPKGSVAMVYPQRSAAVPGRKVISGLTAFTNPILSA